MTSQTLPSDFDAFARVVDRLAASRARLSLEPGADGTMGAPTVRVVAERPGDIARYLADDLRPVERLLARLLDVWGEGYGCCLFFELWGSDARRYGADGSRLRRAALVGPGGDDAELLVERIGRGMDAPPFNREGGDTLLNPIKP